MSIQSIPLEKIRISDLNVRANDPFGDEEDEGLVKNIESIGILQPIIVRPIGDFYEVDVGRRRFLSAQKLGLDEIPCIVRDASEDESLDASLSENIHRKNLDPVTIARAIKRRLDGGIRPSDYARRMGVPKQTLNNWLRTLDLSPAMQSEVQCGTVPLRDALKVVRMNLSPTVEDALAEEARVEGLETFKRSLTRIAAEKEKRGAPKGLLIVRISFGKKSPDYNKLNRLAKAENMEIGDFCQKILIDYIKAS